ncbi:hypothetical protein ACFPOI_37540 [Nonomuraea angiospora]|uniref:MmyB-like transcription regulator ligand binding domain-containing protein n=1 Tax=Nonomuraea angiospora TaxID=46172 RepID=A0ABR9M2K5_9ACTN|nr:hypothetical protein [Nonomuraea angiospora]MBE1586571.1 hypothetical protein [Nonomuraea angiospora]
MTAKAIARWVSDRPAWRGLQPPEEGRARGRYPSRRVLGGIARALRLTGQERNLVRCYLLHADPDLPPHGLDASDRFAVTAASHLRQTVRHPEAGAIELDFDVLTVPDQEQQVIIFTADLLVAGACAAVNWAGR